MLTGANLFQRWVIGFIGLPLVVWALPANGATPPGPRPVLFLTLLETSPPAFF